MGSYYEERMVQINVEMEARRAAYVPPPPPKRPRPPIEHGHIYFMKAGNVVKIGRSTNLRSRFKSLQTGSAADARIVKILPGGKRREKEFHKPDPRPQPRGDRAWLRVRYRRLHEGDEWMPGSVANSLLGVPTPRMPSYLSEHRTDFVPEPGQIAYGFTFDWGPEIGRHCRVSVGYYPTSKEARDALAKALISAGYQDPRWWQFWRWGGDKLPDDVRDAIRASSSAG